MMNKLTAEKCREFIDIFKSLEKEGHLALASEYHLQAYQKALPVLEQQEKGNSGWIEWKGGQCPVDLNTFLVVRYRGEFQDDKCIAGNVSWYRSGEDEDIIAYRVVEQEHERGEEA